MSYAPTEYYPITEGGNFRERDHDNFFEYDTHGEDADFLAETERFLFLREYNHRVWVNSRPVNDSGWRYALVKETVAYIVIDEDEYGKPVIEKWQLKNHVKYGEQ